MIIPIIITADQAVEFSMSIEDAGDAVHFLKAWLEGDWKTVVSYLVETHKAA